MLNKTAAATIFGSKLLGLGLCMLIAGAGYSHAAPITVTSYDMLNGTTGTFTYFDDTYNGTGSTTTPGAPLTGGTGDLTDGVIATAIWQSQPALYVGWFSNAILDPQITFNFAQSYSFDTATFYFDDANGFGGVFPPASVEIGGVTQNVVGTPDGSPFSVTVNLGGLVASSLDAQIFHLFDSGSWVFLSEVQFDGNPTVSAVPVPAALPLLAGGLGLMGLVGWRRRRKNAAPA